MGSKLLEEKCTVPLPYSNIIVKHIAAFRVCGHHPKTCMTAHHTWTLSSTLQIREYVSLRNIVTRLEFRVWITWPSCYWKYASTQPVNNWRTCIDQYSLVCRIDRCPIRIKTRPFCRNKKKAWKCCNCRHFKM